MSSGYAGDLPPSAAYDLLRSEPKALLVDVRTDAEWTYVGMPDLSATGQAPLKLAWQLFPAMQVNPDFVRILSQQVPDKATPLLFQRIDLPNLIPATRPGSASASTVAAECPFCLTRATT